MATEVPFRALGGVIGPQWDPNLNLRSFILIPPCNRSAPLSLVGNAHLSDPANAARNDSMCTSASNLAKRENQRSTESI